MSLELTISLTPMLDKIACRPPYNLIYPIDFKGHWNSVTRIEHRYTAILQYRLPLASPEIIRIQRGSKEVNRVQFSPSKLSQVDTPSPRAYLRHTSSHPSSTRRPVHLSKPRVTVRKRHFRTGQLASEKVQLPS